MILCLSQSTSFLRLTTAAPVGHAHARIKCARPVGAGKDTPSEKSDKVDMDDKKTVSPPKYSNPCEAVDGFF
jgi:hypothetical protein